MVGSGEEATSGGDKLADMEHALKGFADGVVGGVDVAGEGVGVEGAVDAAQEGEDGLALEGKGGVTALLVAGVLVVVEPEQDGVLVRAGSEEEAGEAGWLWCEAVFGAVEQQGVGVVGAGQEQETGTGDGEQG